jgi:hypothetical protein
MLASRVLAAEGREEAFVLMWVTTVVERGWGQGRTLFSSGACASQREGTGYSLGAA